MRSSHPTSVWDMVTIGGQIFTATLTGFEIARMSLLAGGPAVTISGATVSLAPSKILLVDSSSFIIPLVPGQSSPFLILGGLVCTSVSASVVVIDGTTLSARDQAITVDGSRVSLGIGGNVVIGSITTRITPEAPSSPAGVLTFERPVERRFKLPGLCQCLGFLTLEALFAGL